MAAMTELEALKDWHRSPIEDSILIAAPAERVFTALSDGVELSHWWPKMAESDARLGGRLVLTWFTGSTMNTAFDRFDTGCALGFPFGPERIDFLLAARSSGTDFVVRHACSMLTAVHVAQCWGFLKANLKCWIEHGVDLRTD
jgi:hypothetical protein